MIIELNKCVCKRCQKYIIIHVKKKLLVWVLYNREERDKYNETSLKEKKRI